MANRQKPKRVEQVETHHVRHVPNAAIRDTSGEFAIDDKNHRMWFLATSTDRCDDGMAIDAGAWERDMPDHVPFVDSHARHSIKMIYGKVVDRRYTPRGPVEQVDFATDDIHPDGQLAWYLYRNGYASDVSVAWTTLEKETRKDEEGREYTGVTRARQEELSGCIIGLDPKAESLHADAELVALARSVLRATETRPGWDEPEGGAFIHYRIHDPGEFQEDTYAILSLDVKGAKDVQVKRAKRTGDADDGELHAQAIQFERAAGWTMSEAKDWWGEHKEKIDRACIDAEAHADNLILVMEELKNLRTMVGQIVLKQAIENVAHMNDGGKKEPAYLRDMRRTAEAVTLTAEEVMEQLTRHGSDVDAETRS